MSLEAIRNAELVPATNDPRPLILSDWTLAKYEGEPKPLEWMVEGIIPFPSY